MTTRTTLHPRPCPGCHAEPDSWHDNDCTYATCPGCGERNSTSPEPGCDDCAPTGTRIVWRGAPPATAAAVAAGWWTIRPSAGAFVVPDDDMVRSCCTWNPESQAWDPPANRETLPPNFVRWEPHIRYQTLRDMPTRIRRDCSAISPDGHACERFPGHGHDDGGHVRVDWSLMPQPYAPIPLARWW